MLLSQSQPTKSKPQLLLFQWAPTLGGECYIEYPERISIRNQRVRFNGHPPLGVNATPPQTARDAIRILRGFNGHPPLGVNATVPHRVLR